MAAIPSTGSLIATHDYYRRRIGSVSSNSSCGSSEFAGEVIPPPPRTSKTRLGSLVVFIFLCKAASAHRAERSRVSEEQLVHSG
ncbi:hypothetical protein CgunFtcFv8_001243 [Champsocephalus gunnari]|uniref:Pancreatic progenitor cell differentiation and proliferation factor n=1 Tax=Champsocephalus gunnari TaxID=52237 RepID=A0AAN8DMA4_CHAGU|nr:hypothetical protein CgunFtcFv8_001243 [Champsocephalus gunnari]